MHISWDLGKIKKSFLVLTSTHRRTARTFVVKMERSFFLGIVVLIVLTTFTKGSPIEEENDSNAMRRNSLLEKLGMELHR